MKKEEKIQKKIFPYDFQVELETRAHGNVVARCPLLPGCQAQGRTAKEALDRLKSAIELYFSSASPAYFENLEQFADIPTFYDLAEFKGALYAATGRDQILRTSNGAPGSWTSVSITKQNSKFFTPTPNQKDGAGDYVTQVYCLQPYAAPGKGTALFAGTNLAGSIYSTLDGETWKEAFSTSEDRIHALCEFKSRLYAGTSSKGKIFAFDGLQWNNVGSLSEAAVTCFGVFKDRLYAGTYPSGLIFSTPDGLNWEEVTSTGQNFVQSFKEFNGYFYAGTSSAKGIRLFRTENGRDWVSVYESAREFNLYCLEEFENTLYAGTGNSGRILKSQNGIDWTTAYAGDAEGIRAFQIFGDYLFAGTENGGGLLRSTFDMARVPEISDLKVEKTSSCSALLTWRTDIPATSEVYYAEKSEASEKRKLTADKGMALRHRIHLTDLKSETEYELKIVSANRSSSQAVSEVFSLTTKSVLPPGLSSNSHPDEKRWENHGNIEILLNASSLLAGFYYCLDQEKDTVPAPPEAAYTEENRVALSATPQGEWNFHVVGVDEAGNIGKKASHYQIRIDTEAVPPVKVSSPTHPEPEKWVANPTPVVVWEAAADFSGIKGYFVKADHDATTVPGPGVGEFTTENRLSLGPLEDGLWYVHVTAQDNAGNLGRKAAHYAIRVDTRASAPTLTSATHPVADQWYSNNKVDLEIAPPHDLSGIEGYYLLIDRDPMTLPTAQNAVFTTKSSASFPDMKDGIWYAHARTKDRAGNLSSNAAHLKACVDTLASPPKVSSPTHSETGRWYNNRRVTLDWEDPFEHSGIEGYYYNIDRKPDTVPGGETSLFTSQRSVSFELVDDGLWYFHITTKDKAGNVDSKAIHYPLHVDSAAAKPLITSSTHPEQELWYSKPKAVFKLIPPDDLSGIVGFYYIFSENAQAVPDASTGVYTDKGDLALDIPRDGVFILAATALDAAGNISKEVATFRVRLDMEVETPKIASVSHPQEDKWYAQRRVELTWADPPDLSGIEGYYFAFNKEEHWTPELKQMTWTTSRGTGFTLSEDGAWFVHVLAKDKAGNIGKCAHFRLQADSGAEAPLVKSPTHSANQWIKSSTPKFIWEAPKDFSGVEGYYVALDSQPHTIPGPGNGKWITENSITAPALKDGKWYFHVTAKDKVGNVSREANHYCVLIDTAPPKSQMKALPAVLDKTQISLEWSATDAHSGVVSYDVQVKVGDGPWSDWLANVSDKTAVYKGQDGKRTAFRCRARDLADNVEAYPETEMVSTTPDISPPAPVVQLKAVPKAGGDIQLNWVPVEDKNSGTDYYRVYRWVEGGPKVKLSTDGEQKGVTFLDKGNALKEAVVYYYCVQAVDKMGNEQHEGNQTAASLSDHEVGSPTITSPTHSSDDWSSNPSPILTWTAPADATGLAGYYYVLDQSPNTRPSTETSLFTDEKRMELPNLASGIWYFHLLAKDRAGNISEHAARYRLKIDVSKPEPPHVTSTTHPDARWYSANKVEFKLAAGPKLSGVECYYYAFDQKPETLPLPDGAQRVTEADLTLKVPEPGAWTFHVVVKDKAGNISQPTHFPVMVASGEMPPPVVASPTHPKEDESTTNFEPFFTWEDRHDGSFKPVGYVYKVSPNEAEKLTTNDEYTTERSIQLKNIGEGTWYFHIAAVGKKGKPGSLSAKRKVVIRRMGKLFGTFLRKDGVTPVSGTKIEMAKADKVVAAAVTDAKGMFNFSNLPEGRYELRLHSDQFPVLRLKDIPVSAEEGISNAVFTEDMGIFPTPLKAGPIRFYYFLKEDCQVTLEILDSTGIPIAKADEKKEGGGYAVTIWDAIGRPAGEYLFKLSAKSVTKDTVSRYTMKKFRIEKSSKELAAQPAS